jgi:hypothetical protein
MRVGIGNHGGYQLVTFGWSPPVPGDRQGARTPIIHKRGYQTPR